MKWLKKVIVVGVTSLTILISGNAHGFDGNREGFMMGLGVGVHKVFWNTKFTLNGDNHEVYDDFGGLGTSFRIGYGFNDRLSVYYANEANFFKYDRDNDLADGDTLVTGITGVGVTYYAEPNSIMDGWYNSVIFGMSWINDLSDSSMPDYSGYGIQVGFGHDIAKHVSFEVDWGFGQYSSSDTIDEKDFSYLKASVQVNFF